MTKINKLIVYVVSDDGDSERNIIETLKDSDLMHRSIFIADAEFIDVSENFQWHEELPIASDTASVIDYDSYFLDKDN